MSSTQSSTWRFVDTLLSIILLSMLVVTTFAPSAYALETAKCTTRPNTDTGSTILGGTETRITWEAEAAGDESLTQITLTLPAGTDYTLDDARLTVLSGDDRMTRENPEVKFTSEGQTAVVDFKEASKPGLYYRIEIYGVKFPIAGGEMQITGTYTLDNGKTYDIPNIPSIDVQVTSPTQQLATYLEQQDWVKAWNSNKFLGTFASAEVAFDGKVVYSGVPKAGEVIATGKMPVVPGFRFACTFTTDHLEKPQRLLDNMTPGGSDGFIVDVYLGRPRAIFGSVQMHHSSKIAAGRETTLEVSVSKYGTAEIVVNGKREKKELGRPVIPLADECAAITTAYVAQRYLTACASRGRLPIRFNGTLFTISHRGDPDYRRWGNGYWWQNTRLPYYPMFAAGDIDGTDALFDMYFGKLEFLKKRTKKYFGHDGAYFPECMQPWGDHFMGCYGPECEWKYRKDKHQYHPCHKYAWVGQLELSLMAIMRWQHTRDDAWFKKNALPSIREYVRYFDGHFNLDAKGRYHMYPAQAIETWQDCTNPMTEVAGLTRVTDLLLAMPGNVVSADDRAFFAKIRARLPELPTRKLKNGGVVFAPAEIFKRHGNVETPELYCVFPFRLSSFEKPNAEIGRRTYTEGRFHKLYFGWAQDELNAAYLGMAEEARTHIVDRVFKNTPTLGRTIACNEENIAERAYRPSEYRWPAYWGPNYNWRPDQDEGGVFQNTIQSMLLQYEGDKIFLLPAWPKEWNCDFKLNAPGNTTVEGRVENGELKGLVVTPAARRADVSGWKEKR